MTMALENSNTQNNAPKSTPRKGGKGFTGFGKGLTAPVNKSSSGEALNAIGNHFNTMLDASNVKDRFTIIAVDTTISGLICPAIAVVQKEGDSAAIFTILVEHGISRLAPRVFKSEGEDLVIPTTVGDIYNSTTSFFDKTRAVVSKVVKASVYYEAGQCVIPTECSVDDVENLQRILHRASCATETLLNPDDAVASLADLNDEELVAHIDFTTGQTFTGVGLPVRKGFEISLYANARNGAGINDLAVSTRSDIASLVGYADLTHIGHATVPNGQGGTVKTTQLLAPHIHLVATEVEHGMTTPALQYLGLASAALVLRDNAYEQAFRQKFTGDGVDIHSLNGLKHEIGSEVGAHQSNFDLRGFMAEFIYPTPIFTLDIPECDDLSWCWTDLRAAAAGDQDAYDRVYADCIELTDKEFSNHFTYGDPIAELLEDRVVLGYYKTSSGELVDLRQLDYLAALNVLGEGDDTDAAFAYGDTFNPAKGTLEKRLDTRLKIMDEMTGNSKVVKGYATPVVIYGSFLTALFNSIERAAGGIRVDNPTESVRTISRDQHRMLAYAASSNMLKSTQYGTASNNTSRLYTGPKRNGRRGA